MGQQESALEHVTERAAEKVGNLAVEGRYHRLPHRLEDDYDVQRKALGSGYSGSVMLATGKVNGGKYAVKSFKLSGVCKEKKQELVSETEIILSMDHPHVIRLYDVYESDESLSLVMECMEGGELFDRVHDRKVFSERDACHTTWMMLLALNYLHSCNVVHRDLKLENFLYERKDNDFLKLIDFGFSKIWDFNTKMELSCGTLSYAAPEVLGKSYTSQCDLWSLGVIVFILLVGYMPFSGSSERLQIQQIRSGAYNMKKDRWAKVSPQAFEFVRALLVVDPEKRLTAPLAMEHPWIKNKDHLDPEVFDQTMVNSLMDFSRTQKFRRHCMQLMAWSLSAADRAEVREAFIELDTTRSGKISLGQFKEVLMERFDVPADQTHTIFEAMDSTNDEEIHYSDFLAAMMTSRIELHESLLKKTFARFDGEQHGFIGEEDLKRVLGADVNVTEIFNQVDTNGDRKISYDEFIGYLRNGQASDDHMDLVERAISRHMDSSETFEGRPRLRKRDRIVQFVKEIFHPSSGGGGTQHSTSGGYSS